MKKLEKSKILIVDDHASMRDSIKLAFKDEKDYEIIAEVESAAFTIEYCKKFSPNIVLMDICTEGNASGLHAAEELKEKMPDIKIIIMTGFYEMTYLPRAKEIGADGFIFKNKPLSYFVEVVKKVREGKKVFPEEKINVFPGSEVPLNERELSVLILVAKHYDDEEIAKELGLSHHTIKYYKKILLKKSGFKNTVELVYHLISNGFINPNY